MRSVIAETIDIVIERSQGRLEKIVVDDVVIGVFFTWPNVGLANTSPDLHLRVFYSFASRPSAILSNCRLRLTTCDNPYPGAQSTG